MLTGIAQEILDQSKGLLREWDADMDGALAPFGGKDVHNELCTYSADAAGSLLGLLPVRSLIAAAWAMGVANGVLLERLRVQNDALESIPTMDDEPDVS